MKKIEIINNELIMKDDYATIYEAKYMKEPNDNELRIYCYQFPDSFIVQIRTYKNILDPYSGTGKKRNMIANIHLNIAEVEEILEFMKDHKNRKL